MLGDSSVTEESTEEETESTTTEGQEGTSQQTDGQPSNESGADGGGEEKNPTEEKPDGSEEGKETEPDSAKEAPENKGGTGGRNRQTAKQRIDHFKSVAATANEKLAHADRRIEQLEREKAERIKEAEPLDPDAFESEEAFQTEQNRRLFREEMDAREMERLQAEAQEAVEQAADARTEHFQVLAEDYRAIVPDFDAVVQAARFPATDAMLDSILASDVGPSLAYYLALPENVAEAEALSGMNDVATGMAMARLETKLKEGNHLNAERPTTGAPTPLTETKGHALPDKKEGWNGLSNEEYFARRRSGG